MNTSSKELTVKDFVTAAVPNSKKQVGDNLFLRISGSGSVTYVSRQTVNGKRRQITLGAYKDMNIQTARKMALDLKAKAGRGALLDSSDATTFSEVYQIFKQGREGDVEDKTLEAYDRFFNRLSPIHHLKMDKIRPKQIYSIINSLRSIPSVGYNSLLIAQQTFDIAIKLEIVDKNPARNFDMDDTGFAGDIGERFLTVDEIEIAFSYMRKHLTRKSYLACVLLLIFGCRKNELLQTKKSNFDLREGLWIVPKKKKKKGIIRKDKPLKTPLEPEVVNIISELFLDDSNEYLFPAVSRKGKQQYLVHSALNAAIKTMFSRSDIPIEEFTPHDLRKTCATLLEDTLEINSITCDKYLGHALPKLKKTYYKGDFLKQRREAQRKLLDHIGKYILD